MKELVVVVGEEKYYFEGKDLKAINCATTGLTSEKLIIMDGNKDLAVFQKWDLWKELKPEEEETAEEYEPEHGAQKRIIEKR